MPDAATYTVVATGSNLTYQWKKNGADIPGATQASYTTPTTSLTPSNPNPTATYSVVVSDGTQSVTSQNATFAQQQPDPAYAGDPVSRAGHSLLNLEYTTLYSARGVFRVGYDEGLMNPRWTSYCTYKVATPLADQGDRDYRPDLRTTSRVDDGDFSNTGYTRGHQALMSDLELRYGAQAGTDSCYTTNLAPQSIPHNNNFWQVIEQAVSGVWNGSTWTQPGVFGTANRVWISTGPTFSANPARTAGNTNKGMAIPEGFYKVMVREIGGVPQALALLTPHEPVPANADVWKYVTSVARVEEVTGLNLYPSLPPQAPADFKTTVDVRGWGSPFETTTKPNVHMVRPSWDITVPAGTTVTFDGAATRNGGTIASTTWSFGDGGTATGTSTAYAYTNGGSYTVTFTATDNLGVSNSITRVITVTGGTGNQAPSITEIAAQSTTVDTPKTVTLEINDDSEESLLTVSATSSNETVLPNSGIVPSWNGTAWVLTLTPASGQTGTATVTVTAQDGDGATGSRAFTFSVNSSSGEAVLIISQYYEGSSGTNRWVEVTNIGTGAYDSGATPRYLALWANPFRSTGGTYNAPVLIPSLAAGETMVFKNSGATIPASANVTGIPVVNDPTTSFNGDDILYITPNATNNASAYAARVDVLGINDSSWTGTTSTSDNTTAAAGYNRSWVRKSSITAASTSFSAADWTVITDLTLVDSAATGTSERLGEHH